MNQKHSNISYSRTVFPVPEGFASTADYLRHLACEGLEARGVDGKERLEYELETVISKGWEDWFLIIWDIVQSVRKRGHSVGPGRGSAPASLLCYVLGITDVNPLEHWLLFERFISPDSTNPPDIALDLDREGYGKAVACFDETYASSQKAPTVSFAPLDCLDVIREASRGCTIPDDFDDPDVYRLFANGDTGNVFMFGSDGLKPWLEKIRPETFSDLVVLNAMYRPGPMAFLPEYAENRAAIKEGKDIMQPFGTAFDDILAETCGVLVYQEQLMLIARKAGLSITDTDRFRKAVLKRKTAVLDELEPRFLEGCHHMGMSMKEARALWFTCLRKGQYAFMKAHATAYSVIAYRMAWLKVHRREEFIRALASDEKDGLQV